MRKTAFMLSLGAVCVALLSGCKSKRYRVPTTAFDKVSVALNGVETSYSSYKSSEKSSSSSKTKGIKRIGQSDSSSALSEIATLYTSYDSQGDKIDDLEYDQPPMIQFQCLKKVFESIGKSFTFGTKYTDTISGEVYFDPTTGDKKEGEIEYKYDYNFTLSILIDIDNSDLINADVAFNIELNQENVSLETNWYVSMILDYDMSKESPTYTLSMYSDTEEDDLKYLEYGNTYEYDFVDMKSGRINEWRKFCYEVNKEMYKDEIHPTYESYVSEPLFKAQIGASKWYKNGDLRKISHPNTSKTNKFIGALFDKFGLNKTEINGAEFATKAGVQSTAIKKAYDAFSSSFKQDLIYLLITGSEGHEQQKVKSELRVMDYSVNNVINHITIDEDTTLRELFNGEEGNYSIWYFDQNLEALEQAEDLNTLRFRFSIPYGSNNEEEVYDNTYLDENITVLYEILGKENYDVRHSNAILRISDDLTLLNAFVQISLGEVLNQEILLYFKGIFPKELINLGFPEYEGEACLYDYHNETQKVMDITRTNVTELNAFKQRLTDAGWSVEERVNQIHYSKLVGNKLYSIDIEDNNISNGSVRLVYVVNDIAQNEWPQSDILSSSNNIFDLVAPASKNGYFVTDLEQHSATLNNFTESEKVAFINTLKECGDDARTVDNGVGIIAINVRVRNSIYRFGLVVGQYEITFSYAVSTQNTFHVSNLLIEKEGESAQIQIPLNEDFTGYSLKSQQPFEPGVYRVKKVDLVTSDESYLPFVFEGESFVYDDVEYTITLSESAKLSFYVGISEANEVEVKVIS